MKFYRHIFILLIAIVSLYGCKKFADEPSERPVLVTQGVSNIENSTATFKGKVFEETQLQVLEYGFVWSTDQDPTFENGDSIMARKNGDEREFTSNVSGLDEGAMIFVRAYMIAMDENSIPEVFYADNSITFNTIKIIDFEPRVGFPGSEITIYGSNFFSTHDASVEFIDKLNTENIQYSNIINASDTSLTISVPEGRTGDLAQLLVAIGYEPTASTAKTKKDFEYVPSYRIDKTDNLLRGDIIIFTVFDNYDSNNPANMKFKFDTVAVSPESSNFLGISEGIQNVYKYEVEIPYAIPNGDVPVSVYLESQDDQSNLVQEPILPRDLASIQIVD